MPDGDTDWVTHNLMPPKSKYLKARSRPKKAVCEILQICSKSSDRASVLDETALPDWQVRFCANYEFGRHISGFVAEVEKLRRDGLPPELSLFPESTLLKLSSALATQLPKFPEECWWKIPCEERLAVLKGMNITPNNWEPLGILCCGHPRSWIGRQLYFHEQAYDLLDESTCVVFSIDLKEGDEFLVARFRDWLRAKRSQLESELGIDYSPVIERDGIGHDPKKWRDLLLRLLDYRQSKLSPNERSEMESWMVGRFSHHLDSVGFIL